MEAIAGAKLGEPVRLGGFLDTWRLSLNQSMPMMISEPAEGHYMWLYPLSADPTYRQPPRQSPLRCAPGSEEAWGPTPPLLCEGERGRWRYGAEVRPGGHGQFVAVLSPP